MSSNPFDRNKTKEAKLGELITEPGEQNQRDAVHIAVVPVMARNNLEPGSHVGVTPDGKTAGTPGGLFSDAVGIVDPFLPKRVQSGESFWLFLYQGQVTTLRHEWTHPAFPAVARQEQGNKSVSEAWLRQYALRVNPYYEDEPERAYAVLMEGLTSGQLVYHGIDMHSFGELKDADELQRHASVVLGRPVNWGDFEYFSCTC